MREEEEKIRDCDPEPAALDEDLVEEIALLRKVGGRDAGIVRLRREVVRGVAGVCVDEREEGAQDQCRRIYRQQSCLESCGLERRSPSCHICACMGGRGGTGGGAAVGHRG